MKKKWIICFIVSLLFLQTTLYAFVPNGIPHEPTKPVMQLPKVMLYVDNYLENPTEDASPYIGSDGQIMLPTHIIGVAPWTQHNSSTGEITVDKGKYKIAKDRTTVTTPNGIMKIKNAAAINKNRMCLSVEFLQKAMGRQVDVQTIDGVKCVFLWNQLPPSTPQPNLTPKESYLKYQHNPVGTYYSDKTKHWMSWDTLGGNADNTKTRPKDSTIQEDLSYLNSLIGNANISFQPRQQTPDMFLPSGYRHLNVRSGKNNDIRIIDITGWYSINQKRAKTLQLHDLEHYIGLQNGVIEALKYFSQKQEDAYLIYNYLDNCYANERYPSSGTKMKFGNTEVIIFLEPTSDPEMSIYFNQNNWGDLWTRTTDLKYDYSVLIKEDSPIYLRGLVKDLKSISNAYMIGSNANLTKVRDVKSTLTQDVAYLNTLNEYESLCMCDSPGLLPQEKHDHGPSRDLSISSNGTLIITDVAKLKYIKDKISVTPHNGRKFSIDDSWYTGEIYFHRDQAGDYNFPDVNDFIIRQNYLIEIIKYLSKTIEDGERIYLYLDDCIKKGVSPTLKKAMTFGNTKVMFEKGAGKFGYTLTFL